MACLGDQLTHIGTFIHLPIKDIFVVNLIAEHCCHWYCVFILLQPQPLKIRENLIYTTLRGYKYLTNDTLVQLRPCK